MKRFKNIMLNRIKWNIKSTYDPNWREKRDAERQKQEEQESTTNQSQTSDHKTQFSEGKMDEIIKEDGQNQGEEEEEDDGSEIPNTVDDCEIVWEGVVTKPAFADFSFEYTVLQNTTRQLL